MNPAKTNAPRIVSHAIVSLVLSTALAAAPRAHAQAIPTPSTPATQSAAKSYRLLYTITEMEGGKRIGTQHVAMVLLSGGGRTTLKQGSRVPIATGAYNSGATQTQFTYLDVGLNIDATIEDTSSGLKLGSKIEQSSIAQETSGVGLQDPIIRQTTLVSTSILIPGKPLMLGSLDISGSPRHMDLEVLLEPIR